MEAAATKVHNLAKSALPERPYHLAKSIDQRYRVPPDKLKLLEEEEVRALQYMTLLADVDRGLLLTRPYYDMREEPSNAHAAREPVVKTDRKVTKLSLSDYKNKQKRVSPSPPDSASAARAPEARRDPSDGSRAPRAGEPTRDGRGARPPNGAHEERLVPSRFRFTLPADAHRELTVYSMDRSQKLDTRGHSSHDTTTSPEKRRRQQEAEALARLPKKPPIDANAPLDDRSRTPRDDNPRRKEPQSSQDRTTSRDPKIGTPSTLPNGRAILKSAIGSQHSSTPSGRPRGDSLNGQRSSSSAINRTSLSKRDAPPSKSTVPPLLSPLHFPMEEVDSQPTERRRRDGIDDPPRSVQPKPTRTAPPPPVLSKKERSPQKLPALLSPTLPPALEEELARFKDTPTATKTARLPDPAVNNKSNKLLRRADDDDEEQIRVSIKDKERNRDRDRDRNGQERFIVTLKCGRKHSKTLKRILALPPPKKERPRSASLEAAPIIARKRPASSVEDVRDSIAVKRPRTSDMASSSRLVTPSTPAKTATAMSRGASNNSQGNTPGEMNSVTPGDRPPTRQEPREPANPATIRKLRDRYERYKDLGGRLKHRRDAMKSNRDRAPSESDQKLSIALCLESAMAYMVSFRAVFDSRRLENKAQDPNTWDTILPLLGTLQRDVGDGRHRALDALHLQLKGVILEELIKCYWSLDPASSAVRLMHFERLRANIWKSAYDAVERVDDPHMRCNLGPWTSAEEAIALGLRTVRRWAADEGVDWRPELSPQTNGL
ncbi:conserved hypothetical protein [Verticillium alfalfae VaMs.102]|uniref:Uncharacterized protein n=2 Tax=Verticillium TaxID=1036719 RepID=C9SK66_VERA1|nr:conserved hypothetical protein [Verticillium alfalfae VaMs.102]EEY19084.1 conserved hypothetical protein [Verticillium alfalfae VaMs.102]